MHKRTTILLALLVLVGLQGPLGLTDTVSSIDEMVFGPDSFMRLQRVMDLHDTGSWYDSHQVHTNAPYGETLHWTRPMDMLIYAGAWLISAFTDFQSALLYWGVLISPILLFGTVLVWSWATRDQIDEVAFLLSVALIVLLPQFNAAFRVGRPDHHSLIMFLFVAQFLIVTRAALGKATMSHMALAGVVCGLALWVSIESLLHLLLVGSALGLFWLWQGGIHLKQLAVYLAAAAVTLVPALAIERPPADWLVVQFDRLSVVQLVLVAVGAATWMAIWLASRRWSFDDSLKRRIIAGAIGCVVPGLVMAVLFPKFFAGPFVELSSPEFNQWLKEIGEYHSVVPVDRFTTGMFFAHLAPAFIVLSYIGVRWRSADVAQRRLFLLWILGIGLFMPLALNAVRWAMYVQAVIWLPWTLVAIRIARRPWKVALKRLKLPMNAFATPVIVLGPVIIASFIIPSKSAEAGKAACDWKRVAVHLKDQRAAARAPIMLTHLFYGPEVVWRSGYRVIGAPYGNNDALRDSFTVFRAKPGGGARDILRRREVDLVLVCAVGVERRIYVDKKGKDQSFFGRLARREQPDWLREVDLPPALTEAYRLYRVLR